MTSWQHHNQKTNYIISLPTNPSAIATEEEELGHKRRERGGMEKTEKCWKRKERRENSTKKKTEEDTGEGKSVGFLVDRKIEQRKNYWIHNQSLTLHRRCL